MNDLYEENILDENDVNMIQNNKNNDKNDVNMIQNNKNNDKNDDFER